MPDMVRLPIDIIIAPKDIPFVSLPNRNFYFSLVVCSL